MRKVGRRSVLAGGMAFGFIGASGTSGATVSTSGRPGTVATLGEALAMARRAGTPGFVIAVEPGRYREKLLIDVPGVVVHGTAPGAILTFDAGAALPATGGTNWGTSGSASITVRAPNVILRDLIIRNDHDFPARPMQAVALAIQPGGDRCRIERCTIEGWQDTLLLQASTRVTACQISGNVDFIFGGAPAWIERSEILSRPVGAGKPGFIAAPSTPACQPHGLVFHRCRLTRAAGVADGSVFLGRPWRAGGNMALLGQASFVQCWMDAHIAADGWTSMGYRDPAGVSRQLTPQEARFFESGSRGPSVHRSPVRRQLAATDARALSAASVLSARSC